MYAPHTLPASQMNFYTQTRAALLLLVLPITMPDLTGAVRTGAAGAEAAVPLPLRPEP